MDKRSSLLHVLLQVFDLIFDDCPLEASSATAAASTLLRLFLLAATTRDNRLLHFTVGSVAALLLFTFFDFALEADFGRLGPGVRLQSRLILRQGLLQGGNLLFPAGIRLCRILSRRYCRYQKQDCKDRTIRTQIRSGLSVNHHNHTSATFNLP